MRHFTVTDRTLNDYFVQVVGQHLIEMMPRWIDDTTLQLAISSDAFSWNPMDAAQAKRKARMKASCPGLTDALQWCASKRMGVKLVTIPIVELPNDLMENIERMHDTGHGDVSLFTKLQERVEIRDDSDGHLRLVTSKARNFGHRLVFRDVKHAFEFKLAWL